MDLGDQLDQLTPVYLRDLKAGRQPVAAPVSISSETPTIPDWITRGTTEGLTSLGVSKPTAQYWGERAGNASGFLPLVGNAEALDEGGRGVWHGMMQGDFGKTALGSATLAAALIPAGFKKVGREGALAVGKVGKKLLEGAETETLAAVARAEAKAAKAVAKADVAKAKVVAEVAPPSLTVRRAPKATTSTTGERERGGILGTPDLRTMSTEDAIKTAGTEPHLILDSTGQYHGAPEGVRTMEDIQRMRDKFDADAKAGIEGGDWYTRARATNKEWAGPDPARQRLLAREEALWSAQAEPDTNLNFSLQGHNAYEMGVPLDLVRTGQQAKTYREARDAGRDIRLGPKTGIYGQHLDPTVPFATTGTNDIWHARAFGYTQPGKADFSRALKEAEHRFLDYETMLAVKRANEQGWGGRSDWAAHEIQAAPWVAGKGRGIARKLAKKARGKGSEPTEEELAEGLRRASMTYPDFANKYTAFGTSERIPYIKSGHLPGLVRSDEATRAAYSADPDLSWGEGGRDIIYDALGAHQRPMQEATGLYTPPGGKLEMNPATVSRPLVGVTNEAVAPAARGMLNSAEALRAYVDVQGAGAWHKNINNAKPGDMGSAFVSLEGAQPHETLLALRELSARHGLPDIIDTGQGVTFTSFGDLPSGRVTGRNVKGPFGNAVLDLTGGRPERVKVDSGYLKTFEGKRAQGSGAVTARLEKMLGRYPGLIDKLDASEALRQRYQSAARANAVYGGGRFGSARPDVQNALGLLGEGGVRGLFAGRARGVILPAVGATAALPLVLQPEEPGSGS